MSSRHVELLDTIAFLENSQEYLLSSIKVSTMEYETQLAELRKGKTESDRYYQVQLTQAAAEAEILHIHLDEQTTSNAFLTEELLQEREVSSRLQGHLQEAQDGLHVTEASSASVTKRVDCLVLEYEGQLESQRKRIYDLAKENELSRAMVGQRVVDLRQATKVQNMMSNRIQELEDTVLRLQTTYVLPVGKGVPDVALPPRWMDLMGPTFLPHVSLVVRDTLCSVAIQCEDHDAPAPPYDVVVSLRQHVMGLEAIMTASRYEKASPQILELVEANATLRCELDDLHSKTRAIVDSRAAVDPATTSSDEAAQWKREAMTALKMAKEYKARANDAAARLHAKEAQYQESLKSMEKQYVDVVESHASTMSEYAEIVYKLQMTQNENIMMASRLHSMQVLHRESCASMESVQSGLVYSEDQIREWKRVAGERLREIEKLNDEKTSLEDEKTRVMRFVASERTAQQQAMNQSFRK